MTIVRKVSGEKPRTVLPPGAVDAQAHIYLPGFPARDGGPALPLGRLPDVGQYRDLMNWLGIARVVVVQANAHGFDNANLVACLADLGRNVARGVAVVSRETSEAELRRLGDAGVVGARIMALPGGAMGLDRLEEVDRITAERDWTLTLHIDGTVLPEIEDRLASLGSRWILDHHGKFLSGAVPNGPEVAALLRLIDRGRCWLKFAGPDESSRTGPPDYADVAAISRRVAAHAPERIVWGSNFPHNGAKTTADYPNDAVLADTVLGWLPDDAARLKALVTNPQELYGFPPFS